MFDLLHQAIHRVEKTYDRARWAARRRLGISPIQILTYNGYGTDASLTVLGRVVADYNIPSATETDKIWQNALNMIGRFRSHEIPRARVRATFRDQIVEAQANEEGHFHLEIDLPSPMTVGKAVESPDDMWHDVTLTLINPPGASLGPFVAQVMVPPASAEFGVISDLDDTVIQTDVLNVMRAARNTFLRNAYSRLAFPGVAEFYQALQRGTGEVVNPVFYVSNMPWNLYDLMHDFFRIRHIPRGPMFLTDLGVTDTYFIRPPGREHKLAQIDRLLSTYSHLPFILIGDAGEEDPGIYFDALQKYPSRIKAIYIRDLPENKNADAISDLIVKAAQLHVDLLLVPDTLIAAEHAAQHGYITPESVAAVRAEIQIEQAEE